MIVRKPRRGNVVAIVSQAGLSRSGGGLGEPFPEISTLSPADNATGVTVTDNLLVTFSKPVAFHSVVLITLRTTSDDAVVQTFTEADIAGAISISGNTLTINPTSNLGAATGYYVLIGATSIKDSLGRFFTGIAHKTVWNFTSA